MNDGPRLRVSAYGLAVDAGRLLLTRLSEASPIFEPGRWHLPGGGIDPGEQPVEALEREFLEETGLTLLDARLVDARSYAVHRGGVDWQLTGLFYTVTLAPGTAAVTEVDGSTDRAEWLPPAALREAELSPAAADGLRILLRLPAADTGIGRRHALD